MRKVVFRGDQQAGGILVDAVDDAGALFPADAGERVPAVPQQRVDQRPVRMPGGGMDDEAAGLVDHDHVVILENHVQRDLLRHERHVLRRRERDDKSVARGALVVLFDRRAVQQDAPGVQQPLRGAAGQLLYMAREESVDPVAALLCKDHDSFVHGLI